MGGAVGAAPTNTGLQGNNSSQSVGMGGGLPMASPTDNAMAQFGGQQAVPASQLQPGFNPFTSEKMGVLRQDPTFAASSDEGMFAPGSFQQQPAGLNTLTGLYSGSGGAGIDPQVQQAKQQSFGFGGAYGQQAQARQQGMFQQPQQYQQQSPFQQQPQFQGLQQLLSRMMSNYQNRPQYGSQPSTAQPMPAYSSPASSYKPDYMRAQEALNRTATTQAEAQAAAAAKAAENLAQAEEDQGFLNWQRQQYLASKNQNYSGG